MRYLYLILIILALAAPAHAYKFGPATASVATYAPSAPVSVNAAAGNGLVTLTWSAGTVDGTHSAATSYDIYRSTSSGTETLWQSNKTSGYVDTASNGTTYYYKIAAVNSAGSTLSSEVSAQPTVTIYAPNIPVIGTATAGNAQATVAFTASVVDGSHSAATSYTATSSPGGLTATGASSPLTVTGLTNGQAYTFTVTATNTGGTSAASSASNSVMPSGSVGFGTEDFTGPAGVYAGTFMKVYESSSGKAELNGSGALAINLPSDADDAFVTYKDPLTLAATHTYKRKFTVPNVTANTGSTGFQYALVLFDSASVPSVTPGSYVLNINFTTSASAAARLVRAGGYDNTNTYNELGASGWVSAGSGTTWQYGLDTTYVASFETTATQWRLRLLSSDETTVYFNGPWMNWSTTKTFTNNAYIGWGDVFAGAHHGASNTDSFITQ